MSYGMEMMNMYMSCMQHVPDGFVKTSFHEYTLHAYVYASTFCICMIVLLQMLCLSRHTDYTDSIGMVYYSMLLTCFLSRMCMNMNMNLVLYDI